MSSLLNFFKTHFITERKLVDMCQMVLRWHIRDNSIPFIILIIHLRNIKFLFLNFHNLWYSYLKNSYF